MEKFFCDKNSNLIVEFMMLNITDIFGKFSLNDEFMELLYFSIDG